MPRPGRTIGAWTYHGRFYQFENVRLQPQPVQARVPIGIANNPVDGADPAVEERILRRIARLADGWQMDAVKPDVFRRRWERIQRYPVEYGRAGQVNDAQMHLMVNINDNRAAAHAETVDFLDKYYGQGTVGSDFIEDWLAYGSPRQVVEKIGSFIEAGMTTMILRFTSPAQREQLERCLSEVLPHLAGPAAASRPAEPAGSAS